jgi:hypothetical protein
LSALITFLDTESFPVFNDLWPELSGRESDELEAGRESDELEAGRESDELEAGRESDELEAGRESDEVEARLMKLLQAACRILHSQLLRIFACWVRAMGRGTV